MDEGILNTWVKKEVLGFKRGLFEQILVFCRLLRGLDIKVTTTNVLDLFRSLNYIDITEKQSFYYTVRANLISSYENFAPFDKLFQEFWGKPDPLVELLSKDEGERSKKELRANPESDSSFTPPPSSFANQTPSPGDEERQMKEERRINTEWEASFILPPSSFTDKALLGYSPLETLAVKDFGDFEPDEAEWIKYYIRQAIPRLFTLKSRRKKGGFQGTELDFRKTLRKSLKQGGHIIHLFKKRKKIRKNQLLLLCDVSGSMDAYSSFLIQFIHTMQSQLSRVETWVFSTRITRVTEFLKTTDLSLALSRISRKVTDWSGGTDIGGCLSVFNRTMGKRFINHRTVVIIISDGWDRGETKLFTREMKRLKMNAYKIIWLNPLLGLPNYRPINKGMAAALPYLDYFLPAHNLESLLNLGKVIQTLTQNFPKEV